MLKLSLEAIQIIDAIERTGSMSGAAEELHKVPSTISYSVAKLEEQLDIRLFERNGPRISLTAAGIELMREGRWLLQVVGDLECRLRRIATGFESELRIVHDSLLPTRIFANDLRAFEKLDCGTRIHFNSEAMTGVWEALREGRADLVIAVGEGPAGGGFIAKQIGVLEFDFCVAPDHPLATFKQPLRREDLMHYNAVVVADSARNLPTRSAGLQSGQTRITVPDMWAKRDLQIAGIGFGFLPGKIAEFEIERGTLIRMSVEEPRTPEALWLAWRTGQEGEALRWWASRLERPMLEEACLHG